MIKFHSIKVKNVRSSSKFGAQPSQSSTPEIWSRSLEPSGSNLFGAKAPIWNSLTFSALDSLANKLQLWSKAEPNIHSRNLEPELQFGIA